MRVYARELINLIIKDSPSKIKIYHDKTDEHLYMLFIYKDKKQVFIKTYTPYGGNPLGGASGQHEFVDFIRFIRLVDDYYDEIELDKSIYVIDFDPVYTHETEGIEYEVLAERVIETQRNIFENLLDIHMPDGAEEECIKRFGTGYEGAKAVLKRGEYGAKDKLKVTRLYVDNYKSLVNFDIYFTNFNILLGKNGCGKSTVFEVIYKLQRFLTDNVSVGDLFGTDSLTRWQTIDKQIYNINLDIEGVDYNYILEVYHDKKHNHVRIYKEELRYNYKPLFKNEEGKAYIYNPENSASLQVLTSTERSGIGMLAINENTKLIDIFKENLSKIVVCTPWPHTMESYVSAENQRLSYGMSNYASFMYYIYRKHPREISRLFERLEKINPAFEQFYYEDDYRGFSMHIKYKTGDVSETDYRLDELSDGEKAILVLYTIAKCLLTIGYVVFIDEPDNYIGLREIYPWCNEVEDITDTGSGQCVVISHHPDMIDFIAPEKDAAIWLDRSSYGSTRRVDVKNNKDTKIYTYSDMIKRGDDIVFE